MVNKEKYDNKNVISVFYKITYEPLGPSYPAHIQSSMEKVYQKLQSSRKKDLAQGLKDAQDLLIKYPDIPQFSNYLVTAYQKNKMFEAQNNAIIEGYKKFPNYLFARYAYAKKLLHDGKWQEIPGVFNNKFELSLVYPERKKFHVSEVLAFADVMICYFLKDEDLDQVKLYVDLVKKISPDSEMYKEYSLHYNIALLKQENRRNYQENMNESLCQVEIVDVITDLELHLAQPDCDYPFEIIEQMEKEQEYVTPKLLEKLEHYSANPSRNPQSAETLGAIVSLFVLAKFREKRAFPLVVKLCSMPTQKIELILGDIKTENIPSILASTFNGDYNALFSLVTNQYLDEFLRWSALNTYVTLYKYGILSRDKLLSEFKKFFVELKSDFSVVPTGLVSCSCDAYLPELYEQIKNYYDLGVADKLFDTLENIQKEFARPQEEALKKLKENNHLDLVDDLYLAMGWVFEQEKRDEKMDDAQLAKIFAEEEEDDNILPARSYKIGRNEYCPCDSGKKYKRCCGNN